ncbi:MAG: response regulator [Gemmatimonas sp.]
MMPRSCLGVLATLLVAAGAPGNAQQPAIAGPTSPWSHEAWTAADGLPGGRIVSMAQSAQGYLWAITSTAIVRFDGARFTVFRADNSSGFPARPLTALVATRNGDVWVSSEAGDVVRVRDGRLTTFDFTRGLTAPFRYAVTDDGSGQVWLSNGVGLYRVDGDRAVRENSPISWKRVGPLLGRRDSTLYVVVGPTNARGAGALQRRSATGAWSPLVLPDVSAPTTITQLYEDARGVLWVLSNNGVWSGRAVLRRVPDVPRSLPSAMRFIDGAGVPAVYAASVAGTYRLTADSVARVALGAAMSSADSASPPLWVSASSVWFTRDRRVWRDGRAMLALSPPHSTVPAEAYRIVSALPDREGGFWLATAAGELHRIQSTANAAAPRPLRPVVEQLVASDSRVLPDDDDAVLSVAQRSVQIDYTAPSFSNPLAVQFRYRLEEYDREWVRAGARRAAFYTKLPPGRYTFSVQAASADGAWTGEVATLAFRVSPHWWETTLFRVMMLVLAVAGGALVMFRRVRVLRTQTQELESVVADRSGTLRQREQELARQNTLLEAQARQLQALDTAKTRFFANVSHELRTPLTLTIGPLEDLQARGGRDAQEERWIEIALRNSRRLLRLVNQILDVAKLEAGQMELRPRPLDLSLFVRGIIGAFASVAERKQITLTLEAPHVLKGMFDADAIEKVLTNLLSNAVKFTPNGGAVRLKIDRSIVNEQAAVTIRVIDTGPGIPAAQLALVFERFYQVDETDARLQAGTGIGLALVKELVELHGGRITADSDPRGTMFTLEIPYGVVDDAPAHAPRADQVTGPSRIPLRPTLAQPIGFDGDDGVDDSDDVPTMLVVDDSDDLRAYIRDHFQKQYRVLEAHDGAEGLAVAQRELPDIVVSDVMMPGTDGFSLVRALRDSPETDFLAIVLLTAQAEDEKRLTGLKIGADDYLVKPFDMRELDVRVANLIAARRRWQERVPRRDGEQTAMTVESTIVPLRHDTPEAAPIPPLSAIDEQFRERVLSVIDARLSDSDFGVAELADAVAQDRSHLFRRVKQAFGTSPSNLLRERRLELGARLLIVERGTVADVAYAIGFNSVSYFCQCFLRQYGETPATYRASAGRST